MKTILLLMLLPAAALGCRPRETAGATAPEAEPTAAARPWLADQTTQTTPRQATVDAPYAMSLAGKPPLPRFMDALTTAGLKTHAGRRGVAAIEWKTDSEKATFGYYILRADRPEGPFARINPDLPVAAGGDSSVARYYAYYDTNVSVGQTYYYNLEEIDLSGKVEKKVPKPLACTIKSLFVDGVTSAAAAR